MKKGEICASIANDYASYIGGDETNIEDGNQNTCPAIGKPYFQIGEQLYICAHVTPTPVPMLLENLLPS